MSSAEINSVKRMIVLVAFIDGALRITNIPTFYLWKDYLGVSPGVNCLLRYVTKLPWCAKPLFAYVSDRYYLFGYRTKIYLILLGVFQAASFALLSIPSTNTAWVTLMIFLSEAAVAFRDTLAEGLMVVVSRREEARTGCKDPGASQKYVMVIFVIRFVGTLGSSFVSGLLLERFTPQQILGLCAVFPLVNFLHAVLFYSEERVLDRGRIERTFGKFSPMDILRFTENQGLTGFLFYVVALLLWPNTISGVRYYLIDNAGMTAYDIGTIFTLSSFLYLAYMFLLNAFFPNYRYRAFYTSICVMMVVDVLVRFLQMLPALRGLVYVLAVADQTINNLFYDLPMIPLLAIVCRTCPDLQEATYYAFFVSVSNFFCSMANFNGYVFLGLFDVSSKNFANMQAVNVLAFVWTAMAWHLLRYVKIPSSPNASLELKSEEEAAKPSLDSRYSSFSSIYT